MQRRCNGDAVDYTAMPQTRRQTPPGTAPGGARGLSTARAVLQVQALLARHPDGVRADEVAATVGKSVSTAYNLLTSLVEEGVAVHVAGAYRLTPEFRELIRAGARPVSPATELAGAVEELFVRTHKRSYLALVRGGRLRVVMSRGLQGMPGVRGLGPEFGDDAHASALGKISLAFGPRQRLQRHLTRGLRAITPQTITRPEILLAQLAAIRAGGIAVDRRELDERFWSLALPLLDPYRRLIGALALAVSSRTATEEREQLAATLHDVVAAAARAASGPGFQDRDDRHVFLDQACEPAVASPPSESVRLHRGRTESVGARRRPTPVAAPQNRRHGP